MNFAEQPPSKQWAPLKFKGEKFAEVWFKPEGTPFGLTFRIPQKSFQTPAVGQRLTTEVLLKTVGIALEEVESWRHRDVSHPGMDGSNPEFSQPFAPPPEYVPYLSINVTLKPPPQVAAPEDEIAEPEDQVASPEEQLAAVEDQVAAVEADSKSERLPPSLEELQKRWTAVLGVEGSIDTLRLTLESARLELETAWNKSLTPEERLHALNADVVQWNKEKNRVHYALPKVKEFIHRATWAAGTPERKKLEKIFNDYIEPRIPFPEIGTVPDQLENLLKDRQVLFSQGVSVHQECTNIASDIRSALARLQLNSAANAKRKRDAGRSGGKFFKEIRRWSGAGG